MLCVTENKQIIAEGIAFNTNNLFKKHLGFLFYLIRNILAEKVKLSWSWNHKVDDGKVLPSSMRSALALKAVIADVNSEGCLTDAKNWQSSSFIWVIFSCFQYCQKGHKIVQKYVVVFLWLK